MLWGWVATGLFTLLPTACLSGYWLGRRTRARQDEAGKSHVAAWEAALLGLTALLIGFTFSMAQARYDARKEIVLNEANAIGTTYLRTRLLDAGPGEELRALLRRYVDARLGFAESGHDRPRTEELLRQSEALADEIWARVVAAGRGDRSAVTALLVASTNEMIDAADEHLAAIMNPMPPTMFLVLILVTAAAIAAVGYECGLEGRMRVLGMVVMPVLLAIVIMLVYDLAHPRVGIVRVHDPILSKLKQSF